MRHSRPRSWFERLRRRLTRRTLYRCDGCGWRGWQDKFVEMVEGPRGFHRALTDAELEGLEPDKSEGERK